MDEQVMQKSGTSLEPAKAVSPDFISNIAAKANDFQRDIESLIRRRPLTIMAGALVAGFLLNRLIVRLDRSLQ